MTRLEKPVGVEAGRSPFRLTGSGPAMMRLREEIERAALDGFRGVDRGGDWRRQGDGGAADSSMEPAEEGAVGGGELRGAGRLAGGGGVVRHRGSDGDGRAWAAWEDRDGA